MNTLELQNLWRDIWPKKCGGAVFFFGVFSSIHQAGKRFMVVNLSEPNSLTIQHPPQLQYNLEKKCLSLTCLNQLNPFEIANGPILFVVVMIACLFRQAKRVQLHTEYSTRLLQADEDRLVLVVFLKKNLHGALVLVPNFCFPNQRGTHIYKCRAIVEHLSITIWWRRIKGYSYGLTVSSGSQWVNTCINTLFMS